MTEIHDPFDLKRNTTYHRRLIGPGPALVLLQLRHAAKYVGDKRGAQTAAHVGDGEEIARTVSKEVGVVDVGFAVLAILAHRLRWQSGLQYDLKIVLFHPVHGEMRNKQRLAPHHDERMLGRHLVDPGRIVFIPRSLFEADSVGPGEWGYDHDVFPAIEETKEGRSRVIGNRTRVFENPSFSAPAARWYVVRPR